MAFKLITVLCATLAFAHGGLLAPAAYSPANEVSHVYSSIGSIGSIAQPAVVAHASPVIATAHSAPLISHGAPILAGPAVVKSYAAAGPIYSAPVTKIAYSPASEVSHVYNSIAAPSYATYGGHGSVAYASPAIGSSQQSITRSLGGTISSYSKAVDTPFSSVRKSDTRISNNYYTPALATKTIAYQQPAILEQKTIPATVVSHVTFDGLGAHYAW